MATRDARPDGGRQGSRGALRSRSSSGPLSSGHQAGDGHDQGCLYVVSTPIGNLADITHRAIEVLSSVALIVAEDTRHSRTLLDHYSIPTPAIPYHEHNEARETPRLITRLQSGDSIAIISDAGTPLISDPGNRLVDAAIAAGIPIVPIPGPSALLAALVASGLATDRFTFYGFLPRKGKERAQTLNDVVHSQHTSVVYEAPTRVADTLQELATLGAATRSAVVARELTKKFETLCRGTVAELAQQLETPPKGEVVIILAAAPPQTVDEETLHAHVTELRAAGTTPRDIADRLTSDFGVPRNVAYKLAHDRSAD